MKKKNRIKKDNEIQELKKQLNDYKKTEEEKIYYNIPHLETEEEAAQNIADIYERKDKKARTFAPKHNVKKKYDSDIDFGDSDLEDFNLDNKRKKKDTRKKNDYNINYININGLDKDGYNINGLDKDGLDKDGYNINGIKGTREKYPNKKLIG